MPLISSKGMIERAVKKNEERYEMYRFQWADRYKHEPEKMAYLVGIAETGNTSGASVVSGVSVRQHKEWLRSDWAYAADYDEALTMAAHALETEARRRALGYSAPVWYKGKKVGEEKVYSDSLLQFLLKGALPEKYREAQVGAQVNVKVEMTEEAAEARERRLNELLSELVTEAEYEEVEYEEVDSGDARGASGGESGNAQGAHGANATSCSANDTSCSEDNPQGVYAGDTTYTHGANTADTAYTVNGGQRCLPAGVQGAGEGASKREGRLIETADGDFELVYDDDEYDDDDADDGEDADDDDDDADDGDDDDADDDAEGDVCYDDDDEYDDADDE